MVEIKFTRRAMRDIRKLPKGVRRRIELKIGDLFVNVGYGDELHGEWEGYRKLRAGDYRIIYKVGRGAVVEIQYVRHRRKAYRK